MFCMMKHGNMTNLTNLSFSFLLRQRVSRRARFNPARCCFTAVINTPEAVGRTSIYHGNESTFTPAPKPHFLKH